LLKQLKGVWKPGTVVIDTTVRWHDGRRLTDAHDRRVARLGSAGGGRIAARSISIAAAFQNLGGNCWPDMTVDCDVLVCSDDDNAKKVAMELATKILECVQ